MALTRVGKNKQLHDLVCLMSLTGLRPEEACTLKTKHIHDGWFHVDESKTKAGIRDVPIHQNLENIIERLMSNNRSKYLLSDIVSNNKYNIRSDPLSKRFGRLKTKLGYGPKHVLYSIRHTVITLMDQAGIATSVIADTVGHEQSSFTKRVYSGGSSMDQKREAIEALTYPYYGW
jgi:integrase